MKNGKNIEEVLKRGLRSASKDPKAQMDAVRNRVLQGVLARASTADETNDLTEAAMRPSRNVFSWTRFAMASAAAALLLAVVGVMSWRLTPALAVASNVEDSSKSLQFGDIVRANDAGSIVVLADGSRIEMKSQSELVLERAADGVRIRLNEGVIIVDAAKQRQGHLYVQTKDVMVSVVGTVFLVNAEEEGSRVAVIEGEVRVKQGAIEKSLHPGQQVLTEPVMQWQPVSEEIAWSRSKETHLALLQQSTAPGNAASAPKETFDVVSIRPTTVQAGTGGRGQGGGGNARNPREANQPCSYAYEPRIDPRRFDAVNATVVQLVAWAYGLDCSPFSPDRGPDFLFGGPAWARNDGYDVLATRPEGPADYTTVVHVLSRLDTVPGPKLQRMVQTMLADRFKLEIHREMRETSVYVLSPMTGGPKFTAVLGPPILTDLKGNPIDQPSVVNGIPQPAKLLPNPNDPRPEFSIWQAGDTRNRNGKGRNEIHLRQKAMADFIQALSFILGRPVIDRTNLTGVYNFFFMFEVVECATCPFTALPAGAPREGPGPTDNLFDLLKKVGLELKASREQVEVLVIDRVERPSEN